MDILKKIVFIHFIILSFTNCSKSNDDLNNANALIGNWQIISGAFSSEFDKYLYINNNGSLDLLSQTPLNFKNVSNIEYTGTSTTITFLEDDDNILLSYEIDGEFLTILRGEKVIIAKRIEDGPEISEWVVPLDLFSQTEAPWAGNIDIAFTYDKSNIVVPNTDKSSYIGLLNPVTFEEEGQITTTQNASVVEIESFDVPDKYVLQNNINTNNFYAYTRNDNSLSITSLDIGEKITGIASIGNGSRSVWLSVGGETTSLYRYNYETDPEGVSESIKLDIQPMGLDSQGTILYVCDGTSLHKCQTNPNFQVLSSFNIPNLDIKGVAFDGNTFWVSGFNTANNVYIIGQTNLLHQP